MIRLAIEAEQHLIGLGEHQGVKLQEMRLVFLISSRAIQPASGFAEPRFNLGRIRIADTAC